MIVEWEYWPEPVDGEQSDPLSSKIKCDDMADAVSIKENIHSHHGDRLIWVDMVVRIFNGKC